ncbi:MAG: chain length determinant protein EpsF [Porticoccaceae bacterium]
MDVTQLFIILRAHLRVILLTLFVTVATTIVVSFLLPKTYSATASVIVNYETKDPLTGLTMSAQQTPGYMPTQLDIMNSRRVALLVVESLKLVGDEGSQQDLSQVTKDNSDIAVWVADDLLETLKAESRENIINVTFKDQDRQRAADIANAFASAYQQVSVMLKVEPLNKTAGYFDKQIEVLRENYAAAQSKLSQAQQRNGIVTTDDRFDVESERLNELSRQFVAAQGASMGALARRVPAQDGGGSESPDIIANPLIQTLKSNLGLAESRFAQVSQKVARNHPQYLAAKAEVDELRATLNAQIIATSSSVVNNARILQQHEARIGAALEAQKVKMLALNKIKDDLQILAQEVAVARQAYETAMQRFTQLNLEGQSNLSDVIILNPAMPPLFPTSPKIVLNVLVAIFLGVGLGLGFGFVAEMLDPRVRSEKDLVAVLQAPVLGEIGWSEPPRRVALPSHRSG